MVANAHSSDIDLIERIIAREQDALTDLYDCYGAQVFSLAQQVTGQRQAAEDVTQDVFFQVWRWPERWDPDKGRLISWLLTVTRYTAIDAIRREQRQPQAHEAPGELAKQPYPNGGRRALEETADRNRRVREVLKKLPPEQRKVILLAFFRGMTHEEIAKHLKLPVGTVKSRIRLGMQKLKAHITDNTPLPVPD